MTAARPDDLLLSIDCGKQSARALLFDPRGRLVAKAQVALDDYGVERSGWITRDRMRINEKIFSAPLRRAVLAVAFANLTYFFVEFATIDGVLPAATRRSRTAACGWANAALLPEKWESSCLECSKRRIRQSRPNHRRGLDMKTRAAD